MTQKEKLDKLTAFIELNPELNKKIQLIIQAHRDILVFGYAVVSDPDVIEAMTAAGYATKPLKKEEE